MGRGILVWCLPLAAWCAGLDRAAEHAMEGNAGTALVAEAASGRLLGSYRLELARKVLAAPGSTLKPFALEAWIEAHGGAAPEPWPCARQLRLGGHRLDCVHPVLARPLDATSALAYSCNCYFAHLARELDARAFAQALRGIANNVSTAGTPEELELEALGEWGIRMTPLEMLAAWRRLARERRKAELEPLFAGLEGAATYGSGQLAGTPGLQVAGKTGTGAGHAWFAGFAPASAPEVVVVVFLERGRGGGDAAPVAGEILRAWGRTRK